MTDLAALQRRIAPLYRDLMVLLERMVLTPDDEGAVAGEAAPDGGLETKMPPMAGDSVAMPARSSGSRVENEKFSPAAAAAGTVETAATQPGPANIDDRTPWSAQAVSRDELPRPPGQPLSAADAEPPPPQLADLEGPQARPSIRTRLFAPVRPAPLGHDAPEAKASEAKAPEPGPMVASLRTHRLAAGPIAQAAGRVPPITIPSPLPHRPASHSPAPLFAFDAFRWPPGDLLSGPAWRDFANDEALPDPFADEALEERIGDLLEQAALVGGVDLA